VAGQSPEPSPDQPRRDESYLRNHVRPPSRISFGRLERGEIQAWVKELSAAGLAPRTVRMCHQILKSILDAAVASRLIAESPCKRIVLPGCPTARTLYLTAEEWNSSPPLPIHFRL